MIIVSLVRFLLLVRIGRRGRRAAVVFSGAQVQVPACGESRPPLSPGHPDRLAPATPARVRVVRCPERRVASATTGPRLPAPVRDGGRTNRAGAGSLPRRWRPAGYRPNSHEQQRHAAAAGVDPARHQLGCLRVPEILHAEPGVQGCVRGGDEEATQYLQQRQQVGVKVGVVEHLGHRIPESDEQRPEGGVELVRMRHWRSGQQRRNAQSDAGQQQ